MGLLNLYFPENLKPSPNSIPIVLPTYSAAVLSPDKTAVG